MARLFFPSLKVLEEFFGSPAVLEYTDIPLEINNIEFTTELEGCTVWFKLIGSQHRGELRLVGKPFSVVKLALLDISRVSIRKTQEDHYMRISFARKHVDTLELWLRPKLLLSWGNAALGLEEEQQLQPVSNSDER